jgi:hypothetical protein
MRKALILAGFALAVGISSCAQSSPVTTSSGGGSGGGTTSSASGGGNAPGGDAIPPGAVSFFSTTVCPDGWSTFDDAVGRMLLPTVGNAVGGTPYGIPLASGEDRTHTHDVTATFTLPSVSYAGLSGGGNHGVGSEGSRKLAATSDPASTGLPYVQLLVCKKTAPAAPSAAPLPKGMRLFFTGPTCPSGFQQAADTQGLFLVGLPKNAKADASFGGLPQSGANPRTHAHQTTATLTTSSHGIALVSGGLADGYAANGSYMDTEDTTASGAALPYLELLQCEVK